MIAKREQAMKYYDKVIDQSPMPVDYLNAGHVAWSLGNVEKPSLYIPKPQNYMAAKSYSLKCSVKTRRLSQAKESPRMTFPWFSI